MYKDNTIILSFLVAFVLVILSGCTINKEINVDNKEYLKERSIAISLATYTGTKNIIDSNTSENTKELLLNAMERNTEKNINVKHIEVNSLSEEDNKIIIITKIEEGPALTTILFHEFTYENINGQWIIVDFGEDA